MLEAIKSHIYGTENRDSIWNDIWDNILEPKFIKQIGYQLSNYFIHERKHEKLDDIINELFNGNQNIKQFIIDAIIKYEEQDYLSEFANVSASTALDVMRVEKDNDYHPPEFFKDKIDRLKTQLKNIDSTLIKEAYLNCVPEQIKKENLLMKKLVIMNQFTKTEQKYIYYKYIHREILENKNIQGGRKVKKAFAEKFSELYETSPEKANILLNLDLRSLSNEDLDIILASKNTHGRDQWRSIYTSYTESINIFSISPSNSNKLY